MNYRLYEPDDFAALYAIEEVCFQLSLRFSRRFMRQIVDTCDGATWIAAEDGAMAGFAIVEWASRAGEQSAYIQTIEVLPEQRSRGVGSELLLRIEESSRRAGAAVLWLHVDESNADAIRLYEARSFLRAGKQEHYYAPGRGALLYKKSLMREN